MADTDHVHGEMDVSDHNSTWSMFMTMTTWGSLIIILAVGYATFTLTMGVNWVVALGGFALLGIVAGALMNMGGAWIATVIGLAVLAIFIQILIMLGQALM